jgi:putative SOS response-associated peptidase YedK
MAQFARYIGIDYSGAETADSSCKGIRTCPAQEMAAWKVSRAVGNVRNNRPGLIMPV